MPLVPLNTFKSLSGKVINKVDLKNIVKNINKNDKKKEKEQKNILDIFKEIIPKYIDVFLIDCKVLCVSDELYNCKLETILVILICFYISKIGENKCKIYFTEEIIKVSIFEANEKNFNEINYEKNLDFNINEKNIDGSNFFSKSTNQLNEKKHNNKDILFKIFNVLGQIKGKFFFEENVIPDSKIPKSDDFKDFLDKAEMNIYLGIKDEIKILIIILYYFYLGIKHNVYSKLFKKQEEIKNFSLDKIKKEIEDVIQNKNCKSIRFYNFIVMIFLK